MIAGGTNLPFAAGANHVAGTVLVGAKKRSSAVDALLFSGFGGIVRGVGPRGIARHAAGRVEPGVSVDAIPVAAPFPDIAGHVVETVGVRGKLRDGSDTFESILTGVAILNGEPSFVNVRPEFSV